MPGNLRLLSLWFIPHISSHNKAVIVAAASGNGERGICPVLLHWSEDEDVFLVVLVKQSL